MVREDDGCHACPVALRCLIVDDNAGFLDAARALLEGQHVAVAGVASTGAEAVRRAGELRPDVALVDIDLGDEDGFEVARRLADPATGPVAPVILISTYAETDFADLVAQSPAVGFLSKADLSARAIDALLRGDRGARSSSAPPGT
jgi:DNA-binding NarL/FixJ family response regulator